MAMLQPSPESSPRPPHGASAVTELLLAWGAGDPAALDALLPVVYEELRQQARRALRREGVGHTLQPTALVHEAYLRLVDQRRARWESRTQFFAVAAQVMRRVLVDHARTRRAAKRGSGAAHLTLADADLAAVTEADVPSEIDVLGLDDALERLAALDPDRARLVELRYFAGLSIAAAAAVLGVSPATVGREGAVARLWLRRELDR
jgi:RNA polymerase sigma factor (TIGR02999 family)